MAANKIELEVSLKENLSKLSQATGGLKLDKGQQERFSKYSHGAQLALESGDLKTFQKNFNSLLKLFKEAAPATGKVSEEIKKLTARQSALNQEINRLKDKKTTLESKLTKDGGKLTAKAAREFASTNTDAKKVITGEGKIAARDEIIELQKALNDFLQKTGKTLSQVTNQNLQEIKTVSGLTYKDRTAMFAGNRYVKAEQEYQAGVKSDLSSVSSQIELETQNYTDLTEELNRMTQAAQDGADGINKLYAEISKLGDDTNKAITEKINKDKIGGVDRTGATGVDPVDTKRLEKQSTTLGKAFKQFTLYNIVLKAAKTALKEAVQTVKELDKYLTEQAMVTGLTREQTYGLVKSYQNLAAQCGATTKEIAQVSTEYMKQGKSIEESLILTEAAVKAAKVARVSVGDSVNYLTTALNGFQLAASDAMKVSDKFAAVAASSATDYDELAIALSKVASQANLAGMSIDYTTALLTKGLETTREAPETMGTALKTIIARMRELGDYGETLEDGTDINNVESQLNYVGIALRDQQGELRSTEEVLDELGKKWDTLNKNQQAAIAKALAGTRQQARLIAMMEDYERVTELQEISQRSAGATAAQAGVYLEGMEASLNKIQVAWEKIVMTVTDSEVIIGVVSTIGDILEAVGDFLSTDFGLVATLTTVLTILTSTLATKISENMQARAQQKLQQASLKLQLQERKQQIENLKTEIDQTKEKKKQNALDKLNAVLNDENASAAQKAAAEAEYNAELLKIENDYTKEINALKIDEIAVNGQLAELGVKQQSVAWDIASATATTAGMFGGLLGDSMGLMTIMSVISGILQVIPTFIQLATMAQKRQNKELTKGAILSEAGGLAKFWPWGVIAAAALLAIVGIAVAIKSTNSETENTADKVNELSNEIYKLNEKANAINNITSSFDKLDDKLIKTNADLKEMSSLLDQAADKLTDDEKEIYSALSTDREKRQYLSDIERNSRDDANRKRSEQIHTIGALSNDDRQKLFADSVKVRDAVYALNNNKLYEYLDLLKEDKNLTNATAAAVETLTQNILENMNIEQAWAYAQTDTGEQIQILVNSIKDLTINAKNLNGELEKVGVAEILSSDDYGLKEKVAAYREAYNSIASIGDYATLAAFNSTYLQYEYFSSLGDNVLEFADKVGLTIDKINDLYGSWETLRKKGVDITQEEFEGRFETYLETLAATQGDVLQATKLVFGGFLNDSEDALNAFISAYGDLIQVGVLNMGQNMDKVKNSINNFYEKALEWNSMSESDRAEFIQDNAAMFSDENMLSAFESGNYEKIEEALKNNQALQQQLEERRREIKQELLIEEARVGEDRNEAYIAQLKEYQNYLNDVDNLFKASLQIRLDQEKAQLEQYKEFLEDQRKAEEESLEKRKEIYQKYFDEINKTEEAEDYEEKAEMLIKNLSKLGSSDSAESKKQTKELEQQLNELEKERQKELRERAQEAVVESIDDQLEQISDKFDKLLENNQALLAAMRGDLNNPVEYIGGLIENKIEKGATANELQSFLGTLQSTYGSSFKNGDLENIKVREENNQLILNVNGKEVVLDTQNEQNLYAAIMKALTEIGLR